MAMDQSDVKALRSDALGPAEIEAKAETLAVGKAGMAGAKCFVLAMLAGAFIAFGATYFLVFLGDSAVPFAAQRMVGGICFSLGLVLVLCCGAELFTGNMLMVTGLVSKKIKLGGLVRNWVIVWLGNLVGSLIMVALIYWCGVGAMNGGAVGDAMVSVAVGKVTPDWLVLMAKGIMCQRHGVPGGVDRIFRAHRGGQGPWHHAPHQLLRGSRLRALRGEHVLPAHGSAHEIRRVRRGSRQRRRARCDGHPVQPVRRHGGQHHRRRPGRPGLLVRVC